MVVAALRQLFGQTIALEGKRIVFVGGLQRSGTSPLYKALLAVPGRTGIYGTHVPEQEGQFLQSVYEPDKSFGILYGFERDCYLSERDTFDPERDRLRLLADWGRFWSPKADVFVEKTPSNIVRLPYLKALFPEGEFIVIVRHPLAYSLALKKWSDEPLRRIIEHWLMVHKTSIENLLKVDGVTVVRYEDICDPSSGARSRLQQRHGVATSADLFADQNVKYFETWGGLHLTALSNDDRIVLSNRYGQVESVFGYSLDEPYVLAEPQWMKEA
ncbi:sulfotransferase [Congregibacter brevis]|uniref:Sulfotransferase n=1 Tax=Congregibacter brevis TaxID=3081201 RepID=A0ABZ0IFG8_9GAMM|nr:sulfotransferase [Congregibacter sp. IMCC45268]